MRFLSLKYLLPKHETFNGVQQTVGSGVWGPIWFQGIQSTDSVIDLIILAEFSQRLLFVEPFRGGIYLERGRRGPPVIYL